MPTTVPPITSDVLTALRQGDERTLERLFRERYSSLTEEAASVLHHATSAAHCVEGTFVQTWKERERFQTPEELESFLHQCVREGAVQRESRRAVLQHFDSRAAHAPKHAAATVAPPVDEAWARVAAALHAPPPDPEALAHAVADHSRHEAAVHVKEIAKGPPWVLIAVLIAVIVGVSYVGLKALNRAS